MELERLVSIDIKEVVSEKGVLKDENVPACRGWEIALDRRKINHKGLF